MSSGLPVCEDSLPSATRVWNKYVSEWGHVPMIRKLFKLDEREAEQAKSTGAASVLKEEGSG